MKKVVYEMPRHDTADKPTLSVLSLGAGVQSTALLLMYLHGEIKGHLDCAIFADTGWEPQRVYDHLERLEAECEAHGLPLYKVSAGNIRDDILQNISCGTHLHYIPPFFAKYPQADRGGMLSRTCTRPYKITPVGKEIRRLLGVTEKGQRVPKGTTVEQWMGISLDEYQRMRTNELKYITNRYPLIDKRMTRWDCLVWLHKHGYSEPPKSSCLCCPYKGNAQWREIRDKTPSEWADVVAFDHAIRRGLPGVTGEVFLHSSMMPLDEVDLSTPEDHGQLSLFGNECMGVCGT